MLLTVKEMEALCVFYAGTLSATLDSLRAAAAAGENEKHHRLGDIRNLISKLSGMKSDGVVSVAFEPEE